MTGYGMVNQNQCPIMLVHGAWHRPDCWNGVMDHIKKNKFPVIAPSLDHSGKGGHLRDVSTLLSFIRKKNLNHIVLVGHSYGGAVIADLAARIPHKVSQLVFLNAFVPVRGKSIMDDLPRFHQKVLFDLARASASGALQLPFQAWRDTFMNGAGEALTETTYRELVPEHIDRFTRVSTAEPVSGLDLIKTYIHATEDIALPPGKWGWLPRMPARLGDHRLIRIAGNHEVIFTEPDLVAETIMESVQPGLMTAG